MFIYRTESLELLRQRIDLVEVLSPHVELHKSGASYKACCPFHDEKTPSFMVQKGDSHYHCFGCGAHGDAIAFLMNYLKLDFVEAVESLAEKFGVVLEKEKEEELHRGTSKTVLRQALAHASRLYQFFLLHTEQGEEALRYLQNRSIDLDFMRTFQIGYSLPGALFHQAMQAQGVPDPILEEVGLLLQTSSGRSRDFFSDRIMFPICDPLGHVIGFSGRKFREETPGGKYVNSAETPLFKKSHVLFGLSYSRRSIAKKREAIIVEGQIDALRMIHSGFDYTVAGQGTAFGEGHVKELLHLGVVQVFLALDGDDAGRAAAIKIGDLFQKKGVGVKVVCLPQGKDPDSLLRQEGREGFAKLLDSAEEYLAYLFSERSKQFEMALPAGKNSCLQAIVEQVKGWDGALFVHESVRRLALLAKVPEEMLLALIGDTTPYVRRTSKLGTTQINLDQILERDLLRWLVLLGKTKESVVIKVLDVLTEELFKDPIAQKIFSLIAQSEAQDLLGLVLQLSLPEEKLFFAQMMEKKVNLQKAEAGLVESTNKLLQRDWSDKREALSAKMRSGALSEEEQLFLAKELSELKMPTFDITRQSG